MDTWQPITEHEMKVLLEEELALCLSGEREEFSRIRIPLRAVPIVRYGNLESVFAVAEKAGQLLIFEDIEEGFEWCRLDDDGVIREYYCNQFSLSEALCRLLQSKM